MRIYGENRHFWGRAIFPIASDRLLRCPAGLNKWETKLKYLTSALSVRARPADLWPRNCAKAARRSSCWRRGKQVLPGELLSHKWPYELPFANLRGEKQAYFYQGDVRKSIRYETHAKVGVDRVRVLGGRTMHWNAVTLRYAPQDFREWSLAGVEEDWPLTYEELGALL